MTTPSNSIAVVGENGLVDEGSIKLVETGTLEFRALLKEQQQHEEERKMENVQPLVTGTNSVITSQNEQQQYHETSASIAPLSRKRQHLQEESEALLQEVVVKLARW